MEKRAGGVPHGGPAAEKGYRRDAAAAGHACQPQTPSVPRAKACRSGMQVSLPDRERLILAVVLFRLKFLPLRCIGARKLWRDRAARRSVVYSTS